MDEATLSKFIAAGLIFTMTAAFGYLPAFISRKSLDENHHKSSKKNAIFAFLLNFGGGVLFANCFCHWLPEVREGMDQN